MAAASSVSIGGLTPPITLHQPPCHGIIAACGQSAYWRLCWLLLSLPGAFSRAAEPAPLPPIAGASEAAAKQRAALFVELAAAKDEADARAIEQKIWKFWLQFRRRQLAPSYSRNRERRNCVSTMTKRSFT